MATLIPEYSFEEIIKVYELGKLNELQCGEVIVDGEYLFTFFNGNIEPSSYQRTQAEYSGQVSNSVGGRSLEELLMVEEIKVEEPEKKKRKKRKKRSYKELANAIV